MEYLVWVTIALFTFGMVAPLTSVVTKAVPPDVTLFMATFVFLGLTLGIMAANGDSPLDYALAPPAGIVYLAGLFLSVGILAYYYALETGPVSVVVPIYGMFIVGSSIIGIAFLGEAVTVTRAGGIGCAVVAVYLSAGGAE